MNILDFYKKFIILSDYLLPSVSAVEHPILFYIFSFSVANNNSTCQLSYEDFHQLTGLSLPTVKKALKSLIEKGYVRLVNVSSARTPKTYELVWPQIEMLKKYSKLQRLPDTLIRELCFVTKSESIVDKLTSEDTELLNIIISSLTKDEESEYRNIALSLCNEFDDKDKVFKEIVVRQKFGKIRLAKYNNEQ